MGTASGHGVGKGGSREPRWPALLAILTTGLVYGALPEYLLVGPWWLLIVVVAALEVPALVLHQQGYHRWVQVLGFVVAGVITAFEVVSLVALVTRLPGHRETPEQLLRGAGVLWVTNVLVFAQWYWRLDAGGPHSRDTRGSHTEGAFLFPQMTWEGTKGKWVPRFIDYLFLSFNTSTALSPTDTPVLSRWAKGLVMVQALISLAVVVLLAARAVNVM